MRLVDMSGKRVQLSLTELVSHLGSRMGVTFLVLSVALLLFSDPPALLVFLSLPEALFIWLFALSVYVAGFFSVCLVIASAQMRGWMIGLPTPLIGMLVIGPTVSASELLVSVMAPPSYVISVVDKIVFYYFIAQILEFFFLHYLLPLNRVKDHDTEAKERLLTVGERTIPVRRLRYLAAQEHYVRVVLDSDCFLHRVRISDLVAQLNEDEGIQPHRSWWISRHAQPRLTRAKGKTALYLFDDTLVPVARARQKDVIDWLDANGPFETVEQKPQAAE